MSDSTWKWVNTDSKASMCPGEDILFNGEQIVFKTENIFPHILYQLGLLIEYECNLLKYKICCDTSLTTNETELCTSIG